MRWKISFCHGARQEISHGASFLPLAMNNKGFKPLHSSIRFHDSALQVWWHHFGGWATTWRAPQGRSFLIAALHSFVFLDGLFRTPGVRSLQQFPYCQTVCGSCRRLTLNLLVWSARTLKRLSLWARRHQCPWYVYPETPKSTVERNVVNLVARSLAVN